MSTSRLEPPIGRAALPYIDPAQPERPITVHTYRPAAHRPGDPVVVVQHGMARNGDEYRDFWVEAADKHGVLIVAPTFASEHFPGPESYNNGLVLGPDGTIAPRARWIYGVPARVIAALRASGTTTRARVRLFGHSAGGQFAHRMLALEGSGPFEVTAAGNPGWYTLPALDRAFPEGVGGLDLDASALTRWLATPLEIFAGDQDIDTSDPNLPGGPEALRQGPTRFARAHHFHAYGRQVAEQMGVPFGWRLIVVPGVGHDGRAMSRAAAAWWFEGRLPAAGDASPGGATVL